MLKPETRLKEKIYKDVSTWPGFYIEKIQQVTKQGTPDFFICARGAFVVMELKKSLRDLPDPLQERKLDRVRRSGGVAFVTCPETWDTDRERLLKINTHQGGEDAERKSESNT